MAKVKNALFSLTVQGSLGQYLTILNQNGNQIIKNKSKPSGHPSAAQVLQRTQYKNACEAWQLLTPEEKAEMKAAGDLLGITGFSAWLRQFLTQPPQPSGTIWDAGATFWDNGTTTWDTI